MRLTLVKSLFAAAGLFAAIGSASAAPVNLITNGSFESGLAGWTLTGSPTVAGPSTNPIVAITYGAAAAYPIGAYGEAVPVPNDASFSPDAPGTRGAYFVDDNAVNQGLTQTIFLTAGNYRVGFDAYLPFNGMSNANNATFSAQIAGISLASFSLGSGSAGVWNSFTGLATVGTSGFYSTSFLFNSFGFPAKDVVIDRVYVIASDTGGLVIPEPESLALFGIAAVGLVAARRRKSK